jgi:hypothetical protein
MQYPNEYVQNIQVKAALEYFCIGLEFILRFLKIKVYLKISEKIELFFEMLLENHHSIFYH